MKGLIIEMLILMFLLGMAGLVTFCINSWVD